MGLKLTFWGPPGGWILAYQRLNQGLSKNHPALLIPPIPVLIQRVQKLLFWGANGLC